MGEIEYDKDGIATTVIDNRGLGVQHVAAAGIARTPGPGETIVVEQPAAVRSTGKEEEKS